MMKHGKRYDIIYGKNNMQKKNQEIRFSCASNVGLVRKENQDNFVCDGICKSLDQINKPFSLSGTMDASEAHLFGVFDGMGGEECGDVAACLAAKEAAAKQGNYAEQDLRKLCRKSNDTICQYAEENGILSMGTTAALLAFSGNRIVLCNIGDSKIFRFDGISLKQLSEDHLAQAPFGHKPYLSQNLGIPEEIMIIDPYTQTLEYQKGDVYIICSDGLTNMVPIEEMWKILRETGVPDLADRLVEQAMENGGKDNVTVIALDQAEGID